MNLFFSGLWSALRSYREDLNIHGCFFHFSQAVGRKARSLGMGKHKKLIKSIIALAFLPAEHIPGAVVKLEAKSEDASEMFDYVKGTWLVEPWVPASWSHFDRATRTNNDVEGWHNRFNHRAFNNTAPTLYRLIEELYKEGYSVEITFKLVSLEKLTRRQRKQTKTTQGKLFGIWDMHKAGGLTTEAMLKKCRKLVVTSVE